MHLAAIWPIAQPVIQALAAVSLLYVCQHTDVTGVGIRLRLLEFMQDLVQRLDESICGVAAWRGYCV